MLGAFWGSSSGYKNYFEVYDAKMIACFGKKHNDK